MVALRICFSNLSSDLGNLLSRPTIVTENFSCLIRSKCVGSFRKSEGLPEEVFEGQERRARKARSHFGLGSISGANSAGMRDNREYRRVPPPVTIRMSAFGDSFTYGEDVTLGDTWEKQLALLMPSMVSLKYGVGG